MAREGEQQQGARILSIVDAQLARVRAALGEEYATCAYGKRFSEGCWLCEQRAREFEFSEEGSDGQQRQ